MKKDITIKSGTIIFKNDKILLIKEKFWSGTTHLWNFGTGSWEKGDGNIVNAAKREAREEVGLKIEVKGLYKASIVERDEKVKLYFFFVAEALNEVKLESKKQQAVFEESIIEYRWFEKGEILKLKDAEFVSSTIAKTIKDYIKNPKLHSLDALGFFGSEVSY